MDPRLRVMNTFFECRANGLGYGTWTSNRPTSSGIADTHMLDLLVFSTTLHKRICKTVAQPLMDLTVIIVQ